MSSAVHGVGVQTGVGGTSGIKTFNHKMFGELPVVIENGKEFFGATDVASALEYKQPEHAVKNHCDEDGCISYTVIDTLGRRQLKKFISIGNVTRLIVAASKQSKNTEIQTKAKQYEKWIFDDVMPSVQKHGAYLTDSVLELAIANPDFTIGLLEKLKAEKVEKNRLSIQNKMLEQQVAEAQPKLTYFDTILKSKKLLTVTQIAKDYGMSAQGLNKILHKEGIQYKQSKQWFLYSQFHDKGYTKSETFIDDSGEARLNTKWTQKGRLFIHETLQKRNILAVVDREKEVKHSEAN
ncbi:phage antirepressor [Sutcliffiella halmapala]|uniref:phage antirepressor n=1 Tax=Sutcliffiella halmapala TaxID=79882 RepID=UPI000994993F|nr:phage antirepressor KilAC domain-containing protein [Sutcliffiella halmapala]